ncbi:MAG: flavodoxin family protein [Candidatus Firestonebacteria bacterium]|nr:flavodoxin family protein [Candidatus Firestonebacteria bacterium]
MATRPVLVALLASPRRQGNSAALLQAFLKPLTAWDVRVFHLPSLSIHPCQACDHCLRRKTYRCRYADDMTNLIQAWDTATALVLSTPVYYYGFPSQAKAVIDRCHPLFHDSHWQKHARRPAYLLANCAASQKSEFKVITHEARAFLNTIAFKLTGELLVTGMGSRNAGERLVWAQKRAETLGKALNGRKGMPHAG